MKGGSHVYLNTGRGLCTVNLGATVFSERMVLINERIKIIKAISFHTVI